MMAQLFYCRPDGQFFGSWVGDPDKDHNGLSDQGYIEVPTAAPSTAYFWDETNQAFYLPAAQPTVLEVDAERDRRIDAGIEFQGVMYQSRATDRENIAGAAQLGFMAVVGGAKAGDFRWSTAEADFAWIASDNSLVPMDAPTAVAFGKAAAERKQALIFAGRDLKDMQPIPADFTDDKWWP